MDPLASLLVDLGVDLSGFYRGLDTAVSTAQQSGSRAGSAFSGGFVGNLQQLVGGYGQLKSIIRETFADLSELTGVGTAAFYQTEQVGFETLLKNGEKAKALLRELRDLGEKTPFDTSQLTRYARQLLAAGYNADGLTSRVRTMADAVSSLGGGTEAVGRLTYVLGQVRAGGIQGDDLRQFKNLSINLAEIVGLASGQTFTGAKEAMAYLKKLDPAAQADLIFKGLDARFGGGAERLGQKTLSGNLQNLTESLQNGLLPTGELLLPVVQTVVQNLQSAVGVFKMLNEVTGGAAGLVGIVGGGYLVIRRFGGGMIEAIAGTIALTRSVREYAVAATTAAAVRPGGAVGAVAAGGVSAVGAAGVAAGGSLASRIGAGALTALKAFGPGIAALGVDLAANHFGNKLMESKDSGSHILGAGLKGFGTGAGIGALIGSFIPGIGTAVGAIIGGSIAGIGGAIGQVFAEQKPDVDAATKTAQATAQTAAATKDAANSLQEMKNQILGGGERSRRAVSSMEMEYALYGAVRGIG